jgi:hypothetical protein
MVNKKQISLLLIAMTLLQVNSIRFKLATNKPECFKIPGNNTYVVEYVVSGEKP